MSKTLLVIDDSATVRQIVRWVFHGMDTEVSEAANAQAARDALHAGAPDVILVDYHLPDGSGLALCRELRGMPALSNTRIVLLTGDYHPLDEAEAASCGADATLKKPFKSQPLIDITEGGTEHQASGAAPSPTQPPAAAAAPATREPGDSNLSFEVDEDEGEGAPPPPPSGASGARPSPTAPGSGLRNAPPAPGSGARKLPPVPGSGLRNLPPVPGSGNYRSVSGATRLPRSGSPTGNHSPVRDAEETVSTQVAAAPSPNEATTQAAPAVPTPAAATPAPSEAKSPAAPAPTPTQSSSGASPAPGTRPGARSAEQITTEISAVSEDEASADESAAGGVSDAQLRRVLQEMLPPLIRRAVVEELQSGLNDKVISHGRRSVDEWVENKLPLLAEQVIGRKLDE